MKSPISSTGGNSWINSNASSQHDRCGASYPKSGRQSGICFTYERRWKSLVCMLTFSAIAVSWGCAPGHGEMVVWSQMWGVGSKGGSDQGPRGMSKRLSIAEFGITESSILR